MNFIDQAKVSVHAGKGGDGRVSFRREKFISRGGPDGGDGGDGGDVILKASNNTSSLAYFRYSKHLKAEAGQPGGNKRKHGKSGKDLVVNVPVGTQAKEASGNVIADLINDGQTIVIAAGGSGGFGNAHFVSSRRQAPNFAEKGEPGESKELNLELKMLADVGLVGLPNAGKSTLLGALSAAKPKVADYPFTTLDPSVGVVDVDHQNSLLFADIPGLIEGAAEGKGLGHDFLRHVERTAVIVHVIDAYSADLAGAYETIRRELQAYSKDLVKRPEIIALNKTEGFDDQAAAELISKLRSVVKPKSAPIIAISAKSGLHLKELTRAALKAKNAASAKATKAAKAELFVYRLPDSSPNWEIQRLKEGQYLVSGDQIERFARRTDFSNEQAVARLIDILKKRGIIHALLKAGLQPGDSIDLSGAGKIKY